MSIKNIVNELPVATWNHLGVNGALEPVFPTQQAEKSFNIQTALPLSVAFDEIKIESKGDEALEHHVAQNKNAQLFLNITENPKEPLHIRAQLNQEHNVLCENLAIHVKNDITANIFHVITSEKNTDGYYSALLKLKAEKNAHVHLTIAQLLDDSTQNWSQLVIEAEEGAHVEVVRVLLGSKHTLSAVRSLLKGKESNFELSTYYHAKNDDVLDVNDIAMHIGENTTSDMYMGGILDDRATKIYRGTIDFQKGAVKAVGKEIDDVLLMSPTVHNRTCPLILCGEESVAGEHAATIGRFNDEQLFYLCSRGLTPEQAKQFLVDAKLYNVASKIKDEALKEKVLHFAKQGFNIDE